MAEYLELPRPWRLLRTAAGSLAEAVGVPVAACLGIGALAGPVAGVLAGVAAVWVIAGLHKLLTGAVPGLLAISAVMVGLQAALVLMTGQAWIYLLQFPVAKLLLSALFARSAGTGRPLVARLATEVAAVPPSGLDIPGLRHFFRQNTWLWAGVFAALAAGFTVLIATQPMTSSLMLCSAATIGAVCAGAAVSVAWFRAVLRRSSLRLRFTPG